MPSVGASERAGWLAPALALTLAVTLLRLLLLAFNRTDLWVDEAQYWLWSTEPAFGYFSKPPLVAWIIALSTGLSGSDGAFWIRAPAPLAQGATALLLGAAVAQAFGARAAVLVTAAWLSLPIAAVGALLISPDTVMAPFAALALLLWLGLLRPGGRARLGRALLCGAALGLSFLGKYSALFLLVPAAVAALAAPSARPGGREALAAALAFAAVAAPNLIWNAAHGFATFGHTLDNTGWRAVQGARAGNLPDFLLAQAAGFGPVFLAALAALGIAAARGRAAAPLPLLVWLSLSVVAAVSVQATVAGANANWAASAYLPGTLAVVPWLAARAPRWLAAGLGLNALAALALPLMTLAPELVPGPGGRPLLARFTGQAALSREILAAAEASGAAAIVATDRAVLADLFHTGRAADIPVWSSPPEGAARNHYALTRAYPGDAPGPVLAVTRRGGQVPPCAGGIAPVAVLAPENGTWARAVFELRLVPPGCWDGPDFP
jgi:hypothetical protein